MNRKQELEEQIADLKNRWPSHSVPPAMMAQLDELEDELDKLSAQVERFGDSSVMELNYFRFQAIGYVRNDFSEQSGVSDISTLESSLVIDPSLVDGLIGLEGGQRVMVIYFFHCSKGYKLDQHPKGDQSRPKRGVFALCSPHRPNPIGVTVVELLGMDGNVLHVRGLDAYNGTPLLDLKPA